MLLDSVYVTPNMEPFVKRRFQVTCIELYMELHHALLFLNCGESLVRTQVVDVDAGVGLQRAGGGLVDVVDLPRVQSAVGDISNREHGVQRKLALHGDVPVPCLRGLQFRVQGRDGQRRGRSRGERCSRVVHRNVVDRHERLEGRVAAREDVVEQSHAGDKAPAPARITVFGLT